MLAHGTRLSTSDLLITSRFERAGTFSGRADDAVQWRETYGAAHRSRDEGCIGCWGVTDMTGPTLPPRAELCSVERIGNLLRLKGEIDQANTVALTIRLTAEVRLGVTHVDLSGVRCCGDGRRTCAAGRQDRPTGGHSRMVLTCSPIVFRILHITGVAAMDGMQVLPAASRGPQGLDSRLQR
jgi:hypothetical protein